MQKPQSKFKVRLHNLMRVSFKIKVKELEVCLSGKVHVFEALTWIFSMEGRG